MWSNAGAAIEEERGDMNANAETTMVAAHFRGMLQFLGFSGSSGPSQVTKFESHFSSASESELFWKLPDSSSRHVSLEYSDFEDTSVVDDVVD